MSFNWNEHAVAADFFKFENPGDTIAGTITAITEQTWPDGKKDPQLHLATDDGTETAVTCGQIQLKTKLVAAAPNIGDHVKLTFTHSESRAGGKTLKHFDVQVTPAGGAPATPEQQPAQAPAQQPAQAQEDPWTGGTTQPSAPTAAPGSLPAETVAQIKTLASNGFTDDQIADFLKIDAATVATNKA
ncbi:hypothetical protein [Micrococcus lylae]|uniref:Uncharacterized protein n=1 Tax=Micrococcus lylae TaxID=1273 RepID=A0ABY2JWI6_9MICC|nr:hypothetical protein [Micrococcus lylae]TFH97815.1 hypothetical protein E4A49_11775 [Micrococcus lylae]